MDVYLDAKETEFLTKLLDRCLEDLLREIHHTDKRAYKAELKSDEAMLNRIQAKLKTPAAMGI